MKQFRKVLALFLALPLLSGCWLMDKITGKSGGSESAVPLAAQSTEFTALMAQVHGFYTGEIINAIPETDIPEKAEQKTTLTADVMPGIVGTTGMKFNLNGAGKGDFSDAKNPMAESTLKISGEVSGAQSGNGELEIGFKTIKDEMFVALKSLKATMDGQELPAELIVGPYLGKWYGGKFSEISSTLGDAFFGGPNAAVDLGASFRNPQKIFAEIKNGLRTTLAKVHFWKLDQVLAEENDMLRYQVSLDAEKVRDSMIALSEFMINPDGSLDANSPELVEMRAEITADFEKSQPTASGILSIHKNDIRLFSFVGTAEEIDENGAVQKTDIAMSRTAETDWSFLIREQVEGGETIDLVRKNGTYVLNMDGKKASDGVWTADEFSGKIYNEFDGTETGSFSFQKKTAGSWSGKITMLSPVLEITISEFTWEKRSLRLVISGTMNTQPLFNVTLDSSVTETNSVTVDRPETVTPIKELLDALGFGQLLVPGMGVPDDSMTMMAPESEFDPSLLEGQDLQY